VGIEDFEFVGLVGVVVALESAFFFVAETTTSCFDDGEVGTKSFLSAIGFLESVSQPRAFENS